MTQPAAMTFWLRRCFPPNTVQRLAVKLLLEFLRYPSCLASRLSYASIGKFLQLIRDREFAFLEDLLKAKPYQGVWPEPAKKTIRPSGHRVCLAIQVTLKTFPLLSSTLESLEKQTHVLWKGFVVAVEKDGVFPKQAWDLLLQKNSRISVLTIGRCLKKADCDYFGFLKAGDLLAPTALREMLSAKKNQPWPEFIYCDEDRQSRGKRVQPFFKPDWSPELLETYNYIGRFFLIRSRHVGAWSWEKNFWTSADFHGLLLRASDHPIRVAHIPKILFSQGEDLPPEAEAPASETPIEDMLKRRKIKGTAQRMPSGFVQLRRTVLGWPKVSVIILTALKPPEMFNACLQSIMRLTIYPNYEMVIVDNRAAGSVWPEEFRVPHLRRIVYPEPFNYSRMNNLAARKALGEYLLFLNDDTEIVTPDWIEALLAYAQVPGAGVVGAKLLYPQGDVQHGGMFLVNQGAWARHAFRHLRQAGNSDHGLLGRVRNCSAVTFACAMVSKRLFTTLGGLDEHLSVECNDVDFCLRALQSGKRNIWTPFAVLIHRELATRIKTHHPGDMAYFQKRWKKLLEQGDPYYNVNLSQDSDMYLPKP